MQVARYLINNYLEPNQTLMKNLLNLTLLFILIPTLLSAQRPAQIQKEGVLVKNMSGFNTGDTIPILGLNSTFNKYLIKDLYGNRFVNINKIKLIEGYYDYWEDIWFKYRAADIVESGWDFQEREVLNDEANDYFQNALQSDIIFENGLLYDYLYQLILDIHPKALNKAKIGYFKVLIIKSADVESFVFDNGLMVMTTGLLASLDSKKELVELLTTHIAHIVLEDNLINLKQEIKAERRAAVFSGIATVATAAGSAYAAIEHDIYIDPYLPADIGLATYFLSKSLMESAGASYNQNQIILALSVSKNFLANNEDLSWHNESAFNAYMAPAISFTAWQAYHMKNYSQSILLTEKLHSMQLALEDDYLLYSKLLRSTSNTEESNLKALEFLTSAQKMSKSLLIDLDKEAALIYLRLGDKENAEIALNNYKKGLELLSKKGMTTEKEINDINQIAYYHKLDLDQFEN